MITWKMLSDVSQVCLSLAIKSRFNIKKGGQVLGMGRRQWGELAPRSSRPPLEATRSAPSSTTHRRDGGRHKLTMALWPCEPVCEEHSVRSWGLCSNVAQAWLVTNADRWSRTHYLLQMCMRSHPETPQYIWANCGTLRGSGWTKQNKPEMVQGAAGRRPVWSLWRYPVSLSDKGTLSGLKPLAPPSTSLFTVQMLTNAQWGFKVTRINWNLGWCSSFGAKKKKTPGDRKLRNTFVVPGWDSPDEGGLHWSAIA